LFNGFFHFLCQRPDSSEIIAIVAAELKFIYFNFLPAEIDIEWKTHQIDHYPNGWHITYNLKDNIVSGFYTTNDEK
jgi:hypothetical protein